jgi:molybdate transport system regulatory protein
VAKAAPRLSIRIEFANGRLGPGKVALLEHIAREGSLAAAARAMGMSYKRAWELLGALNALFAEPVAVTLPGRNVSGSTQITALGRRVIALYQRLDRRAARATEAATRELSAATREARGTRPARQRRT